jgi:hypothetical protein
MSGLLAREVADYLAVRRALGCGMARAEKLLPQFTAYLEQAGAATVTAEHALAWAVLPGGSQSWHAHRLAAVRGFATWLRTTEPAAEIPPAGLIPARVPRATPYLYADPGQPLLPNRTGPASRTASSSRSCAGLSRHLAPPAPRDASAARPPAASARRHRFADIRDTRNRRATSRSLAPASISSAAANRTCSRRARSAASSPPPSAYLMKPAYLRTQPTASPVTPAVNDR